MAYDYSDLLAVIDDWAQQSVKTGWIDQQQALSLRGEQESSASELFENKNDRPLIVAFMGGTGVGKSSLLNKLSGKAIAKTGIERPTSREVTLYHHQSVSLTQLEDTFPLQNIQISQHSEQANKQVVWIDMPDFDSTEEKNKGIVMQWLPYVDVLVYVVSPERYRDNKAWQLLLSEGASHAWLFVMNQWDRGETAQYQDFKQQLAKAGFDSPIIYKTICDPEQTQEEDELPALLKTIESVSSENTVEQLEYRGQQIRRHAIRKKLQQCYQSLGNKAAFSILLETQKLGWSKTKAQLVQGFEWPIKQLAVVYAKEVNIAQQDKIKLWDEWAQSRFNDYVDELILTVDQYGLPSTPLRKGLFDLRAKAEKHIQTQTELSCRKALINPGNLVQRMSLKLVNVCELVLPLIAMSVVGYQVFQGYYDSAVTEQAFLGVDFAVHSSLMVLISWLIPFFIIKKMQPSLEKAAFKGLNQGLELAMTMIEMDIKQAIMAFENQHQQLMVSLNGLIDQCDRDVAGEGVKLGDQQLQRMLVEGALESH